jgi:hypothetical protein
VTAPRTTLVRASASLMPAGVAPVRILPRPGQGTMGVVQRAEDAVSSALGPVCAATRVPTGRQGDGRGRDLTTRTAHAHVRHRVFLRLEPRPSMLRATLGGLPYHPIVPAPPLNGPFTRDVIHPP